MHQEHWLYMNQATERNQRRGTNTIDGWKNGEKKYVLCFLIMIDCFRYNR